MKKNITFRILIIALLLLSYHTTTIHLKQHQLNNIDKCLICHAVKYTGEQKQQIIIVQLSQNIILAQEQIRRHSLRMKAYNITQIPIYRLSDFDGYKKISMQFLSVGYFATAPPYFL